MRMSSCCSRCWPVFMKLSQYYWGNFHLVFHVHFLLMFYFIRGQVDKRMLLENFDAVLLTIDEMVDRGYSALIRFHFTEFIAHNLVITQNHSRDWSTDHRASRLYERCHIRGATIRADCFSNLFHDCWEAQKPVSEDLELSVHMCYHKFKTLSYSHIMLISKQFCLRRCHMQNVFSPER